MLLQTLVQLNILILATPALAGWSLLPPVQAGTVRAACIVWQFRAVEAPAPKAEAPAQAQQSAKRLPAALPRPVLTVLHPAVFPAMQPAAALSSFPAFPHAARAP